MQYCGSQRVSAATTSVQISNKSYASLLFSHNIDGSLVGNPLIDWFDCAQAIALLSKKKCVDDTTGCRAGVHSCSLWQFNIMDCIRDNVFNAPKGKVLEECLDTYCADYYVPF